MTVKRFGWKDRDTAAEDFLQLAYHGPRHIRVYALETLQAFRSAKILPELKELILKEDSDYWEDHWDKVHAIEAIQSIRDDVYCPEIAPLIKRELANRVLDPEGDSNKQDLLLYIYRFVEQHPSNEKCFWQSLDQARPEVVISFLSETLSYGVDGQWKDKSISYIIKLIENQPSLLTLYSASQLRSSGNLTSKTWVQERMDIIIEKCLALAADDKNHMYFIASYWSELGNILIDRNPGFLKVFQYEEKTTAQLVAQHIEVKKDRPKYTETTIWKHLANLCEQALQGDTDAYYKIEKAVKNIYLPIPVSAAATHFLGKLQAVDADVTMLLCRLLQYDSSWFGPTFPIRFEAGEALISNPTPDIWEVCTSARFINPDKFPDNVVSSSLIGWIAYITDVLSGVSVPHPESTFDIRGRPWFTALVDIKDSLEDLGLA